MLRGFAVIGLLAAAACSSKSEVKGGGSGDSKPLPSPSVTIFALAEVRGQVGPCGCTSDPLGDMSRTVKLIEDARGQGPVLFVDAGSLLYSKDMNAPKAVFYQDELKANLLRTIYEKHLQAAAVGLGPADLVRGAPGVMFPRQIANVSETSISQPPRVIAAGASRVGVFGVATSDALPAITHGARTIPVGDPIAEGKRAVDELRKDGAQVVVALVQAKSKRDAVALVRDIGGVDFAIAGLGALAPEPDRIETEATKVGDGWLVIPGNRGQVLSRVDLYVRGSGPFTDAVGKGAATSRIAQLDTQIAALDAELAKFKQDASADPKFVATKQAERDAAMELKQKLVAQPLAVPVAGNFFTFEQIRINKSLACSVPVRDAIKAYDMTAGEANVKAAAGEKVPAPKKGQASYVGTEACSDCHQDQVDQWKTTVHAKAWKTLVDRGQQFDYECISCHVTGWAQPGGSNLVQNETLRDVQCETCHGPGSIHVAKGGLEKPYAVVRNPNKDLCATQCHTKEHSDTFEYDAYMRDIVGPGHGPDFRKKLGDGPTGRDLRSAALDKAGRTLGAGCTK